jgi:predicted transposase YbfD/YdcC
VLGQVKVDAKSNEITAIPKLLKMLEIAGCIITIDAMGCQREIANQIINKQSDYVLALKGNQGKLYEQVSGWFKQARKQEFREIELIKPKGKTPILPKAAGVPHPLVGVSGSRRVHGS